jgi:hypothetical protein
VKLLRQLIINNSRVKILHWVVYNGLGMFGGTRVKNKQIYKKDNMYI